MTTHVRSYNYYISQFKFLKHYFRHNAYSKHFSVSKPSFVTATYSSTTNLHRSRSFTKTAIYKGAKTSR